MIASRPTLSVVIPAYNSGAYLRAAIASVEAQTGADLQIIVVDDGSATDTTQAVAESIPDVVYIHQVHAGAAAARNAGVRAATGTFLAFLDSDDYWAADKVGRQLRYLAEHGTDMVFGHAEEFYSENAPATMVRRPPAATRIAGTLLTTRAAFERAGGFDTTWRSGEFMDWYLRATDLGLTAGMLPEIVLYRRLHAENGGRTLGAGRVDYVHVIKRALDRRRRINAAPDTEQP